MNKSVNTQETIKSGVLDGAKTAKEIREELSLKVEKLLAQGKRKPGLAVILVGDNSASHIYVKNKVQACKKVGIESHLCQFDENVEAEKILSKINELNQSDSIDGILVQLPLPSHLSASTDMILHAVSPEKDVDGLHPYNMGLLLSGKPGLRPCTPSGIMVLLERYKIEIAGKKAVVIGRSNLVGKPIALMLMEKNATVTMCHSRSHNLDEIARQADILVVAAGKQELVKGSWVKAGAVVIDVGIHHLKLDNGESRILGDVNYQEAAQVASYITPVPGGVGPMTVTMLLSNTLLSYEKKVV